MVLVGLADVVYSDHSQDENTNRTDVEGAVVHPAQFTLLFVSAEDCQTCAKIAYGEHGCEEFTEAFDQVPRTQLDNVIPTAGIRVNNWDKHE